MKTNDAKSINVFYILVGEVGCGHIGSLIATFGAL